MSVRRKIGYAFILVILFAVIGLMGALSNAATISRGARGTAVRQIQQKLIAWQYLEGTADGVYGRATEAAVRKFQQTNRLPVTGKVDSATAVKLGVPSIDAMQQQTYKPANASSLSREVELLARCIYAEARNEPYTGKVAVGAVILNRVRNASFPSTIAGVIYQPGAFPFVDSGQIDQPPDADSLRAARDALVGLDPTGGCLFYYNPQKTTDAAMHGKKAVMTIGAHRFCL